jgi:predicted hydrocarbon binding protein
MQEQLKGGRVKGGIIRAHLEWVRQKHGQKGIDEILRRLPPPTAEEVRQVLASSWCAFESVVLLDRAIGDAFGGEKTIRELGRFSAQLNLSSTYRMFRRADIHDFFERSAALHNQFQDFGSEDYVRTGPQAGRITHREYSSFSPTYCESAGGYYEEAMKMHGAKQVSVEHPSCVGRGADHCVFELRWE